MTETIEPLTPMHRMLLECENNPDLIGDRISAVLEFLTLRAVADKPYMIFTDNEDAMVIFAAGDAVKIIRDSIPEDLTIKRWEDELDDDADLDQFLTDTDPGDEQPEDTDEPSAEQE